MGGPYDFDMRNGYRNLRDKLDRMGLSLTHRKCRHMRRCHPKPLHGCVHIPLFAIAFILSMAVQAPAVKTMRVFSENKVLSEPPPVPPQNTSVEINAEPLDLFEQASVVAKGFRSLDGLVLDEKTGGIYVSEEDSATIIRIKTDGSRQVLFDKSTPLYKRSGISKKRVPSLRPVEGLALDGKGRLYAVEDIPGGRLISFDLTPKKRRHSTGTVIPIPIPNSHFAWESIDIGPSGELLIAGSTIESFLNEPGKEGLYRGVLLYRDAVGEWWMILNHTMTSYSAASFSPDGTVAFFACEVSGDVGCLDLRSHHLRVYHANTAFQSPEGLCPLPDGSVLVAEEAGKIYRLDPEADTIQLLYDNQSTIESIVWDGPHRRLLVTDDQRGALLSLELKVDAEFASSETNQSILFESQLTPLEMIPDQCPLYLDRVLNMGGYNPNQEDGDVAFQDFVRHYCLVAIDADAMLISSDKLVEDPIKRIQFVIVAPHLMGLRGGELLWSSSGFAAIKESGQIVKTELVSRQMIHIDLMESRSTPMGGPKIALPMPFSARVNADGIAAVNFMGMGVTPDFYTILNTVEPDHSFMVVIQDGIVQQYALYLPPDRDRNHWVIVLKRNTPDIWKSLSFDSK